MNSILSVLESNMCSGCGLCSLTPNEMAIDNKGYSRPLSPVNDEISKKGCPGKGITQTNQENYNLLWGPIISSQTGHATNPITRKTGSSGGVITGLLEYSLATRQIDAVIQIGTSETNPIRNNVKIVTSPEGLIANSGSRYSPSSPLSIIRSIIGDGKTYAFVGKPCDAAALRALITQDTELRKQFPLILSFMCAGIPSEHATKNILEKFGTDENNLASFRYRGDGWPGLTTAIDKNGKAMTMTYNESWGSILNQKLQARCKVCADGTGESADVVCADAWHESKNGYPSFEESEGRSLILCRTQTGKNLVDGAKEAGFIKTDAHYDIKQLDKIQPYQKYRKSTTFARLLALKLIGRQTVKYKNLKLLKLSIRDSPITQAKAFAGTLIRALRNRI